MTALLGADGQHYDIPTENVEKALASGQFTQPPVAPTTPAPVTPVAPPSPEEEAAEAEKAAHANDKPDTLQDIPLVGADGKLYSIPDENRQAALDTGKFRDRKSV